MDPYGEFGSEEPELFVSAKPIETDPPVKKKENLTDYEPEEVEEMHAQGRIDDDTAMAYIANRDLSDNGLRHMDPDNVEWLWRQKMLTEDQVLSYQSYQLHPIWWTLKDVSKGAYAFAHKAVDDLWGIVKRSPLHHPIGFVEKVLPDVDLPDPYPNTDDDLPLPDIKPEGGIGKTVEVVGEFVVPFAAAKKFIGATKVIPGLLNKLPQIAAKHPTMFKFLEFTAADTAAGAFADASFDPYEGRAADFLNEYQLLPDFLSWMKTNPDNPAALERFKTVLEGAGLGIGFDAVFFGMKLLKNAVWTKNMFDSVKIQAEINQKFGLFMEPRKQLGKLGDEDIYRVRPEADENGFRRVGDSEDIAGQVDPIKEKARATFRGAAVQMPDGTIHEGMSHMDIVENKIGLETMEKMSVEDANKMKDGFVTHDGKFIEGQEARKMVGKEGDERLYSEDFLSPDEQLAGKPIAKPILSTVETFDRAFKTLADAEKGTPTGETFKVADGVEKGGGSGSLVEYVMKNYRKVIDNARGGVPDPKTGVRKSREVTKRGAYTYTKKKMKEFASGVGGGHFRNFAEMMASQMKEFRVATKNMDEVITAFNHTFTKYSAEVADMVKEVKAGNATFKDKMKVVEHIKSLAEMQEAIYGIRADIGRSLGMYNEAWQKSRFDFALPESAITDIEKLRRVEIDNMIDAFGKAPSTKTRMKAARFMGRNRFLQGVVELVQANLLWNPATHIVNLLGNSAALAMEVGVRHFAALGLSLEQGNMRALVELGQMWRGLGEGIKQSLQVKGLADWAKIGNGKGWRDLEFGTVWKALASGDAQLDAMVKVEGQLGGGLDSWAKAMPTLPRVFLTPIFKFIQLPFHSLTAGDELFKNIGYFSEVNSLIFREADKRTFKNLAERKEWVAGLKENIPADIHYKALQRARELTFQQELGAFSKPIAQALNTAPGTALQMTAIPFYKIAVNITKFAGTHSPLAPLAKQWRADVMAGGIKRYEALSRFAIGATMATYALSLYDEGKLTGHVPPGEHVAWQQAEKLPYAYMTDEGEYLSLERLEPFAMIFKMMADVGYLKDLSKYNESVPEHLAEDLWSAGLLAVSESIVNATYMEGLSDILEFMTQPDRMNKKKFMLRQVEKFMPMHTGVEWINKTFITKNIPELEEFRDLYLKKAKPNEAYHKRHSVYGTKIERRPDTALLLRTGQPEDPVAIEMVNIKMNLRKPPKTIGDREMSQEQYAEFNDIIASMPIQERLWKVINSAKYQRVQSIDKRKEILTKIISKHHTAARNMMKKKYFPDVIEDKKRQKDEILNPDAPLNQARRELYHRLQLFDPEGE